MQSILKGYSMVLPSRSNSMMMHGITKLSVSDHMQGKNTHVIDIHIDDECRNLITINLFSVHGDNFIEATKLEVTNAKEDERVSGERCSPQEG